MSILSAYLSSVATLVSRYLENCHFLVRAIYFPRVYAYLIATLITFWGVDLSGLHFEQAGLLFFLLFYPHFQLLVVARFFNDEAGARKSMFVDGLIVGILIVANHYHFIASISFLASLTMSTLIIARLRVALMNMIAALLVCICGYWLGIDSGLTTMWDGKETAAAALVLFYSALVAGLGFRTTKSLGEKGKRLSITSDEIMSVSDKLRRYVSPQIYSQIADQKNQTAGLAESTIGECLHEQSTRKCLTVFFSDIEGFTALMDNLEEETVTRILNEYLNSMAEIAIEHGGTIDKFMGDGIMVFFGDPSTRGRKGDAIACIRMALNMREKVKLLRKKWASEGIFSELHVRIGIHTGYCTVGNFGCDSRMDYTAVGSTVNLASRLEGIAVRDGVLISADTHRLVRDQVSAHRRDPVFLKGFNRVIEAHDVLGLSEEKEPPIERLSVGFSITLEPSLIHVGQVKTILREMIDTTEAIETQRLEKAAMLRVLPPGPDKTYG